MNYVILFRVGSGQVDAVHEITVDGADIISEFPNMDAAVDFAEANSLFRSGQAKYQIVQLDEL